MLYKSTVLPEIKIGQVWCLPPPGTKKILIVAIDTALNGYVINVLIEDGQDINGVKSALAPLEWDVLKIQLDKVVEERDVSEHIDSYEEWKEMAQEGKAGFWQCTPAEVLATIRQNMSADS